MDNNGTQNPIIISFCIPVYNQRIILQECLDSIVAYKGNDIEIVISDDSSTEDIMGLVNSYNDNRIRYHRNTNNLGHSLNIVNAFSLALGEFAFLLRTRDQAIAECIPDIIDFIKNHPNCSYITGNAVDEDGHIRYSYDKEIVVKGKDALKAHFNLYVHPSGSLYSLRLLDISKVKSFLESESQNKQAFVAHSLMRMQLAECGDFGFIRKPMWRYIVPHIDDIAVNKAPDKKSVFDPMYMRQRFRYQLLWCKETCNLSYRDYIICELYKKYLYDSTWRFYFGNKNKSLQRHYSYESKKFSVFREMKEFDIYASHEIRDIFGDDIYEGIRARLKKIKNRNVLCGWEKCFIQDSLNGTALYRLFRKCYRIIKNKRF